MRNIVHLISLFTYKLKGPALPVEKNAAQWVRLAIRNRSSRLAGFTQHIYEFLVLLYRKL